MSTALRCAGCGAFTEFVGGPPRACPSCGLALQAGAQAVDGEAVRAAVTDSPVPVLLDVYAPWCEPCRKARAEVERLAQERGGRLLVLTVDAEANPGLARALDVALFPSFLLFDHGAEAGRAAGYRTAAELARLLERAA